MYKVFSFARKIKGEKNLSELGVDLLSEENCVVNSKAVLGLFRRNPHEFLLQYTTVDKTWRSPYTLDTKAQSK